MNVMRKEDTSASLPPFLSCFGLSVLFIIIIIYFFFLFTLELELPLDRSAFG